MRFLGMLSVILLATLIGGQFSARLKLPAVVGELLAGIIVGPAVLNLVQPTEIIKVFSDIGVIFLMFLAGLDSDLKTLKRLLRPSVLVAGFGMIVPIIIAYFTGILFAFSQVESLFLGLTFSATSVSISVAVLQEMGRLQGKEGMTILGAAVADDLLSIILLSIVSGLTGVSEPGSNKGKDLILSLLTQAAFLILLVFVSVYVIPRLINLSQRLTLPVPETLVAMIIVVLASWGAEKVGLSNVIGAFFAGLALNRTSAQKTLKKNFTVIGYSSFIPIFFVSIGLNMSIKGILNDFILFFVLVIGSVFSKLVGAGLGAKIAGFSNSSSLIVGTGMVSRGEMALVVAQMGLTNHLLAPAAYSTVIGAIIMTTVVSPFLLKWSISKMAQK
ncbi:MULTISPECIES: cation:proton antiporter [unclassified Lactobacillus]|uniref:cation:proton antiporter n=1 Tax=unclassified Lactobacillus TaxID=2620435 RepID=UPI0018DE69D5|nr:MULTISPECIES: cation:proton antiporter [unclassified Lactobacillus]MBH9990422.1 cation:proton antiporter [Lactobacillus sp. M0392]MBI0024792.1 cation:proton antiporter [Lactobacillus sp. W8171]MBI0045463.1 cation:proton antiporter [Lactobacillus sp. M0393]